MVNKKQREQSRPPERSLGKESGLIQHVRHVLRKAFSDQVPHIVAGYSGGKDSLALVLVLRELRRLGVCEVTAVHVDHGLRHDSADAAEQAMQVVEGLGVDCVRVSASADLRLTHAGESVEDVARRFRYQSLTQVLNDVGGDAVAVAHHRRDQAETVLLHMLRGSGMTGLAGMAADTMLAVPGDVSGALVRVIRPFLYQAPETLEQLVRRSGLPVIEDPSNEDPAFRRNRIRHEVLPLLEDIVPGATGRLVSLADIIREDEAALDNVASVTMRSSLLRQSLVWMHVQHAPTGVQRRVVRLWLMAYADVAELSRDRVDAVVGLANRGVSGKRVELGDGWSVRYGYGQLDIIRPGQ